MSLKIARRVLQTEKEALEGLLQRLDKTFEEAVELIFEAPGRVILTGMGKSGLIGQKIAATFASTGTPSFFLHPAEAAHGDLGMVVRGDLLLALSYSGETEEINQLLPAAKRLGIPVIALTGDSKSTLAQGADVALDIRVEREACSLNLAPTASTTAMLAMGDALAVALLERRGFKEEDFALLHPGGKIGKKLQKVEDLMHAGDQLPRVSPDAKMPDVIYEMSRKGLGLAAVVEDSNSAEGRAGRLAGIITDGDLRRLMQKGTKGILELTAADCMTKKPATVSGSELAGAALRLMEERKITAILVVDGQQRLRGVIHVHDLWTTQLF